MAWHHPGKTLYDEFLKPRNLSQNRLARAIKVPPRRINEIVLGKRAISADTAVRLARYFNNEPAYWMKLQTDYDIALATNSIGIHLYAISADEPAPTGPVKTGDTASPQSGKKINRNIRRRLLR
ncbi:MAG: HigA family addiction module antidote protein [Gammaproteobacteria bacterium]|nr:HigA family addiction module antidote protein [Gammaproteobacteria bacterium]